ncbi:MAG: 2-oxoglutarate synthase [Candidatus Cloacimonetes bacterium HGW-Cloacimonetes-3]|jgi:2-oxoglutarate ferredoxin oxidoreductase subunit beta|nr:MAG: 2-oxoglutarate synthase [Candidatus Cloacimonetes bacterium HGW-Cloacimonetes-3]
MRDLGTNKENTWCSGCGNFGILNAVKKAMSSLHEAGLPLADIAITCGIGCHGKIFDYLALSGVYGLHGRGTATASGIKLANPNLQVISFGGDGDSLGEGLEHTLFAAKRNMDITLILHNNGTYGLTTGQFSPLSEHGYKGLSTPAGNIERPFRAIPLLLEAGATFAARGYSANPDHLADLIVQGVNHKGFSFIEVMQPCVSYNNNYTELNHKIKLLEAIPSSNSQAVELATNRDYIYLGVFSKMLLPVYHEDLYQDANPVRDRLSKLQRTHIIEI